MKRSMRNVASQKALANQKALAGQKGLAGPKILSKPQLDKTAVLKNGKDKPVSRELVKAMGELKEHSSKKVQNYKYFLPKKDWAKVCSATGDTRRELFSELFSSEQYSSKQVAEWMSAQYQLEKIDFSSFNPDPEIVLKVPKRICEKYDLIPVMRVGDTVIIAFADPGDIQAKDDVSLLTNSKIAIMVGERGEIRRMIRHYHKDEQEGKMQKIFSIVDSLEETAIESDKVSDKIKHDPTVQSVDYIIKEGIRLNCSDIHIEVYDKKCRVRFRVDGHLGEYIHPPFNLASSIASRVKVISQLDISEKRLPQDGRLKFQLGNKIINFRVSTVPVVNGEKIVLRVLDDSALYTDITDLGMNEEQTKIFQSHLAKSQGLILMTGPTGSGKTTTIYSGLQQLNTPDRNISTAEDPVEYKLHGINQVQVISKIGLTFAQVLRSFLRQDPDVILVGEIRDEETASIAYRAAATGHLVLSTLHTNDAATTITRLMDIGLPAYSVAENTSLVVAQRLLRVLCERCKVPHKVNKEVLIKLGFLENEVEKVQNQIKNEKPGGCNHCNDTGYKGRVAVFEVLEISPELKVGIFKGLSPIALKKLAIEKSNLQTLRRSALEKLAEGMTSVNEVIHGTMEDE